MARNAGAKERLLTEAARLIQTKGFGATSVSELLEAAEVQKGSLYFHFSSKHELGLKVLERAREQFLEFVRNGLAGETPEARLHRFFDAALAAHRKRGFVGGCLWGNTALEIGDSDPEYAALVAGVFEQWTRLIERTVADGQASGQFRADLSPRHLARHIIAAVEGGIMQSRLTKDETPLRECLDSLKCMLKSE